MSKIKTNILYNMAYQVLVLIVPLITSPYISRVLSVKGIGIFSYVSSVAYYFFVLVTMGLSNYGNRCIAKQRDNKVTRSKTFWSIYYMQIAIGLCTIIIYIFYVIFISEKCYKLYFLIYTLYILGACLDINWFFFGMEEFKFTTIRNSIIKLLTVIAVFVFVKNEHALIAYFLIVAGSTLISNLILWTKVNYFVDYYKPKFKECIIHLKPNLVLFIPILAMSIYRVMDKIMIKELSGIIQNGYYENADRIITISLTAFSAIATVMMPAISNMVAKKDDFAIKKIFYDMMQVVNFLSIAMMFGLMAISIKFAPLFFGDNFIESGYLLIGLAPTIFLSGWKNVVRSQYLIPYEKDNIYVISLVVGALVNVIINGIFIPKYGARGAVIGTIAAEFAGFIIQTYAIKEYISLKKIILQSIIIVPAGIIMMLLVFFILKILPYNLLSVLLSILVGAIIYLALGIGFLYLFNKERFLYFKMILKKSVIRQ